ncbi:GNAT family N-acetyltransferase [Gracilibacillus alcaliphilus]|uniref:GNAT family N-acetyltransferase n=1 Tax=Gracilibacillus alcaliphilus TaxID=1401441 RepID=UPI00195F0539|nr:GNAT family N-acetyltransferase [Gracilibacillus alcaliphilus]MBM7677893.1 ribosomal protein S18 acetylase RimI-like enzyme [Gracilibacillus alcaliphilus]
MQQQDYSIILAGLEDSQIIYDVTMMAYEEYRQEIPPSSALDETVEQMQTALADGQEALLLTYQQRPSAAVRFTVEEDYLYFSRLAVIPEVRGKGFAKAILHKLESYAETKNVTEIRCKVRASVPRNISLYQSLGYQIVSEEIMAKPNSVQLRVVTMSKQLASA